MVPMVLAAVALAGCGGDERPVDVAALGDSITEGTNVPERERWTARLDPSVRNCGVFGERTDEIARRLDDCASGASVLIVQGGINDIAQGRDVVDAATDLRAMVRRGREKGMTVLLTDVLPWNNGYPAAAEPIRELNARIREIAREEGAVLVPFFDTLEDPARPDRMKPEWTIDGNHPSAEGHRRLAAVVRDALP